MGDYFQETEVYRAFYLFIFFFGGGAIFKEQGYIAKDQREQMLECTFQEHGNVEG